MAMGTPQWWCEELALLGIVWRDGYFYLAEEMKNIDNVFGRAKAAVAYLVQLKKPTDSRWLTMHHCGQRGTAMKYVGLFSVAKEALESGRATQHYLGGIKYFTDNVVLFNAINAWGSGPAVAALNFMLEDDRLIGNLAVMIELLEYELDFLFYLPAGVWEEANRAVGIADIDTCLFRSYCCHAALCGVSFGDFYVVRKARSDPLGFGVGSEETMLDNLRQLGKSNSVVHDNTTWKLRTLMRKGCEDRAMDICRLMKDIRCTSTITEQAHREETEVHQVRSELEETSLSNRSFAKLVKKAIVVDDKKAAVIRQAERRKAILRHKRPNRYGGKQELFARACAREDARAGSSSAVTRNTRQEIMQCHSAAWNFLDDGQKRELTTAATIKRNAKAVDIKDDIEHFEASIKLSEARAQEDQWRRGDIMAVRNSKLSNEAKERLRRMMDGPSLQTEGQVVAKRREIVESQARASGVSIHELTSIAFPAPPAPLPFCPEWLAQLCRRREHMDLTAVKFTPPWICASTLTTLWMWAKRQPIQASMMRLESIEMPVDCTDEAMGHPIEDEGYRHWYLIDYQSHIHSPDLDVDNTWHVAVLPFIRFPREQYVASRADWQPLEDFVRQNKVNVKEDSAPRATQRRVARPPPTDLPVDQFPWLRALVEAKGAGRGSRHVPPERGRGRGRSSGRGSGHTDDPPPDEPPPDDPPPDDHDPDLAYHHLLDARQRWKKEIGFEAPMFEVVPDGGGWTKLHKGVDVNAYRGFPSHDGHKTAGFAWLKHVGLPTQCGNEIGYYEDDDAGKLARVWVIRMQYLYDIAHSANPPREWTADILGGCRFPPDLQAWMDGPRSARTQTRLRYIMGLTPKRV